MRLRVLYIVSLPLIFLLACADDGESPPPPPWSSWVRCQLPGDVSVALPPSYIVTHALNPADTLLYGYAWTSFQRADTSVFANVLDYSASYTATLTNPHLLFQTPTAIMGDSLSHRRGTPGGRMDTCRRGSGTDTGDSCRSPSPHPTDSGKSP